MKRSTKLLSIFAVICMALGIVLMIIGTLGGGATKVLWDKHKNRIVVYDPETMLIEQEKTGLEAFDAVNIRSWSGNVEFIPSDDYYIEYSVISETKNPMKLENGTLSFTDDSDRYVFIDLSFLNFFGKSSKQDEYIRIYYPEDAAFASIDVELDMGSINMGKLECRSMTLDLAMGSLSMQSTDIAALELSLDMGSANIEDAVIDSIDGECDMGSLELKSTLIHDMKMELNMGNLNLSDVAITGGLSAELDMGSAELFLKQSDDKGNALLYGYDFETDMGDIEVNGEDRGTKAKKDGDILLEISCDMGSILLK